MIASSLVLSAMLAFTAEAPKFVAFAWEFGGCHPGQILRLADKLDKTPLDGIGMGLRSTAVVGGVKTNFNYRRFMHEPAWPKEAFADQIPVFRKITAHKSMRHSFLSSVTCPRTRIPWTDDAEWARIAASMRTVAWVAKQGGLKGLSIDPEDYGKSHQFTRQPGDPPYPELCKVVRRRGRELFKPVFEEYPDVTLHFFWFMSFVEYYARYDRADVARMEQVDEKLWPAFINGVLDVLPPGASINDGEEEGYHHSAQNNSYRNGAYMFHALYPKVIAPENLDKCRRQVRYVPPIYMDMYTNEEGSKWYKGPTEGSRTETLRRDLVQATDVCGGYVWFWGEKRQWVDHGPKWRPSDDRVKARTWAQELPGLFNAMEWVKDPVALYDREVAAMSAAGLLENLAETTALSVTNGYKTIAIPGVKGGEYYGIAFDAKGASARVNAFFKDSANKYVKPSINMVYPSDGRGVVRVPEGGVRGVVVFSAKNGDGCETVFENIRVYRLFGGGKAAKAEAKGQEVGK